MNTWINLNVTIFRFSELGITASDWIDIRHCAALFYTITASLQWAVIYYFTIKNNKSNNNNNFAITLQFSYTVKV